MPPETGSKAELVFEASPYYTNVDYNIPLTDKPIPTITSNNEAVIYRELIKGSLIPRYMVLEASVYPVPWGSTYLKTHSPNTYRQFEIGNTGLNLLESATVGFQEPWAVSAFFGNIAKLVRPGETRVGNNYGYTGYLFSAGNRHIKSNTFVAGRLVRIRVEDQRQSRLPGREAGLELSRRRALQHQQGNQRCDLHQPAPQQSRSALLVPGVAGEHQLRPAHALPAAAAARWCGWN